MVLLSAAEDFAKRTLSRIEGALARLAFVAGLRNAQGQYEHWGMAKIHGEKSSRKVLRDAHEKALADCLRTPVSDLEMELTKFGTATGLCQEPVQLLPTGATKAQRRHLSSVILSLRALSRAQEKARTSYPAS